MKILTSAEMGAIDRATTERHGVEQLTLMENAGRAVAEFIQEQYPSANSITVVCGKGFNGGDGLVAARVLHEAKRKVQVLLLCKPQEMKEDASVMLDRLHFKPHTVNPEAGVSKDYFVESDLVVDAILGTGFRPPVAPSHLAAIRAINASGLPVVSIDIPSGLEADSIRLPTADSIRADAVVTFTALKLAHAFGCEDALVVVRQIGTPESEIVSAEDTNLITPADFPVVLAPRKLDMHKGECGHVLVLGGATGKGGAPAMAGMAALRAGAGLCTVVVPRPTQPTVAGFAPELMTVGLEENKNGAFSILAIDQTRTLLADKRVAVVGPGISRDPEASQFVRSFSDRCEVPIVMDADGLNAYERHTEYLRGGRAPLVITPHPGEMSRLSGLTAQQINADRIGLARKFGKEHNCWIVLKGHKTVIATPAGKVWINPTGNPGMATGGSGDILSGILGGLIAQHPEQLEQAVIGAVYLHGLAGDIARDEMGEASLIATDMLLALPHAFRRAAEA